MVVTTRPALGGVTPLTAARLDRGGSSSWIGCLDRKCHCRARLAPYLEAALGENGWMDGREWIGPLDYLAILRVCDLFGMGVELSDPFKWPWLER